MLIQSLQKIGIITSILSVATVSLASPQFPQPGLQISLEFPPAPNRQSLESSGGGGTRGDTEKGSSSCTQGDTPLTAITPVGYNTEKTVSARPHFFSYIPQTTATMAEFVLIDAVGNDVHIETFELPKTPGIVKIALPEAVTLEVGKTYTWQMAVICNLESPETVEFIEGKIQRIPLSEDLKTQVEATNEPLKQAELYAQERIWQDTLMVMAQVRDANPAEWQQLLQSVGLEAIAASPLIKDEL